MSLDTIGSPALWTGFIAFVLLMLAIDLGVFHRKAHEVSLKEAAAWSAVWVALAAVFAGGVQLWFGSQRALEFTTGYLIEKALAIDNIFVFVVIFTTFAIPAIYQHRVLFWGVLGALLMRALFIFAGGALLQHFHWTIYLFGGILALTGVKLLVQRNQEPHPEKNPVVRAFQRLFPVAKELAGDHFTVVKDGRRVATRLLLALVAVEVTDLIFAVDSSPPSSRSRATRSSSSPPTSSRSWGCDRCTSCWQVWSTASSTSRPASHSSSSSSVRRCSSWTSTRSRSAPPSASSRSSSAPRWWRRCSARSIVERSCRRPASPAGDRQGSRKNASSRARAARSLGFFGPVMPFKITGGRREATSGQGAICRDGLRLRSTLRQRRRTPRWLAYPLREPARTLREERG